MLSSEHLPCLIDELPPRASRSSARLIDLQLHSADEPSATPRASGMSHLVSRIRHGRVSGPRRRRRTAVREIAVPTERCLNGRKFSAHREQTFVFFVEELEETSTKGVDPYGSGVHFRPTIRRPSARWRFREHTRSRGSGAKGYHCADKWVAERPATAKGTAERSTSLRNIRPFCKFAAH